MTLRRWERVGAGWLALTGLAILAVVVFSFVTSRWACDEEGYRFACDIGTIFGFVGAIIAGLHLAAAIGIWRDRTWGRVLGALIAGFAVLGGLLTMGNADQPWLWLLLTAAYLAALFVLALVLTGALRSWGGDVDGT